MTLSRYVVPNYDVCVKLKLDIPVAFRGDIFASDEVVLKAAGFDAVDVADVSPYDGADVILDLNRADVAGGLLGKYDCVLDAGTLEHVYNLPNALACIWKLLKVNGRFVFHCPYRHDRGKAAYYGINPALLRDWFAVNKWRVDAFIPHMYKPETQEVTETADIDYAELPYIDLGFAGYTWGCASKLPESTYAIAPMEGDFAGEWDSCERAFAKVQAALNARTANAYLYGAGAHSVRLIHRLRNADNNVISGVISASPDEIGKTLLFGIPILPIDRVCPGDMIIISSEIWEKVIYERIRYLERDGVIIIRLYGE
jgi:SAM-dependent methyltransferase